MTRRPQLVIAAILAAALFISGCMGKKTPEKAPEKTEKQAERNGGKEKKEDPITSGAGKMQSELADLRGALDAGDTNDVKTQARQLDDAWEGYERKVEAKNPDMYNRVETSLNIVLTGVQLVPFDNRVIGAEIDRLDNTLDELKETKGAPVALEKVDPQTGAAATRQRLSDLNKAVESGDTAQMQEHARAVDRSWTQFEAKVKRKDKKQHETIEDHLHAILAGVKKSPVDKEALKKLIKNLDAQMESLSK